MKKLTLASTACPHCGSSLIGDPIPEKSREQFGGATHFQRQIARERPGDDYISSVQCPDCGKVDSR